jgi:2-polyprenyl-3-methyl-5-hydroxy-6-metoxy-1,4-benzoquinol methylase
MSKYTGEFSHDSAHGHCRELLARAGLESGVVLDLGSASGPLAEPVTALGHEYVGTDIDQDALDELAARGFEAHQLDLRLDEEALDAALAAIIGERKVVAVLLLDVIEHLVDPGPTLRAVSRLGSDQGRPVLVVSIPNVSHLDVGAKLLTGRWDVTDIGLLDDTHLRFFNAERVDQTMTAAGWREVDAHDVVNSFSDQHFPADAPVLRQGVPLRQLLSRVRTTADAFGETYQFVRCFEHGLHVPAEASAAAPVAAEPAEPFLSVIVRLHATSSRADVVLRDLTAQTLPDFEVLFSPDDGADQVVVPDGLEAAVRNLKPQPDWRNAAIAEASARYLAFVDDHTRLAPDFVETIHRLAEAMPGRVVQTGAYLVEHNLQGDGERAYGELVGGLSTLDLDPLDLVNTRPFGSVVLAAHAVPREACATTGLRFSPDPRLGSATLFLLRCIELCGIARTSEPVSAVEPRAVRTVADDLAYLRDALGEAPMVLPEGAGSQVLHMRELIVALVAERDELAARVAAANGQIGALSALVRQRQGDLERLATELEALRAANGQFISARVRRQIGKVARRI